MDLNSPVNRAEEMSDDLRPFHFNQSRISSNTESLAHGRRSALIARAFVHRAVPIGHLCQRRRRSEHLAGVDVSVQDLLPGGHFYESPRPNAQRVGRPFPAFAANG